MTEIGNRSSRSKAGAKGVKIERIYTTPGVHPYDEVTWEKRDVVQQNWKTGETIFEQRGVEFPDFWSVNASTIVTTKYFRGAVGTAAREVSLKQLIDRVVLTYAAAGKSNGYFASPEDAEIFEHELTHALLHQVFSFNSPVWFNVGTKSPQQVSACFILSVDDSMDSILNWYKEEGRSSRAAPVPASTSPASAPRRSCSPPAERPPAPSPSCAAPTPPPAPSSRAARLVVRPRWSCSTSTTRTSRSSSRRRRARRTRSAPCATPASTWTSAARTSSPSSTRTPTTRSASTTSS